MAKKQILAEIVFNLPYATRMHETKYNLGRRSIEEGPSGNKFMSLHFDADGREFFRQLCDNIERRLSKL